MRGGEAAKERHGAHRAPSPKLWTSVNRRWRRAAGILAARERVKNFGNAMDSELTAGGAYVTGETTASFKRYYRAGGGDVVFMRAFLKFDGQGETANAGERAIGGHAAVLLRGVCRRRDPESPHADQDGYVPFAESS